MALNIHQRLQAYKDAADIVQDFNFDKVQTVMNALSWGYFDTSIPPSKQRLLETAGYVLTQAIEGLASSTTNTYNCSTGGFRADAQLYEGVVQLSLVFAVDERINEK